MFDLILCWQDLLTDCAIVNNNEFKLVSSTLSCDLGPLTVISEDLRVISFVFVKLSQGKKIVEEIKSSMGCEFWNNNSLG